MTIRVVILSRSRKKQFAADDHGTGTQSVQHQEQAERFEGSTDDEMPLLVLDEQ